MNCEVLGLTRKHSLFINLLLRQYSTLSCFFQRQKNVNLVITKLTFFWLRLVHFVQNYLFHQLKLLKGLFHHCFIPSSMRNFLRKAFLCLTIRYSIGTKSGEYCGCETNLKLNYFQAIALLGRNIFTLKIRLKSTLEWFFKNYFENIWFRIIFAAITH